MNSQDCGLDNETFCGGTPDDQQPTPLDEIAGCRKLTPFCLPCPYCGEQEASISVRLGELGDEEFECRECEATFSVATILNLLDRWRRVVSWLQSVPQ